MDEYAFVVGRIVPVCVPTNEVIVLVAVQPAPARRASSTVTVKANRRVVPVSLPRGVAGLLTIETRSAAAAACTAGVVVGAVVVLGAFVVLVAGRLVVVVLPVAAVVVDAVVVDAVVVDAVVVAAAAAVEVSTGSGGLEVTAVVVAAGVFAGVFTVGCVAAAIVGIGGAAVIVVAAGCVVLDDVVVGGDVVLGGVTVEGAAIVLTSVVFPAIGSAGTAAGTGFVVATLEVASVVWIAGAQSGSCTWPVQTGALRASERGIPKVMAAIVAITRSVSLDIAEDAFEKLWQAEVARSTNLGWARDQS